MEIAAGVKNLTGLDLKYRYHKNFTSYDLDQDVLEKMIPLDNDAYESYVSENHYNDFFDKSYLSESYMLDDILTVKKEYADPIQFKVLDFGPTVTTIESIQESFNADDFAEIIFLSKYVGDYNITKYGHKLTFDNKDNTLVVERVSV